MLLLVRLEHSLKSFIGKLGFSLFRIPKNDDLQNFFDQIIPVTTEHKLIRLGNKNDGGYLIPDDLDGITSCFSPGVGYTSNFEVDLTKKNIKCFLADFSVTSPPIEKNTQIFFEKKFLGNKNNSEFMTLTDWVDRNAPDDNELLLQMDIEGSEYDVLINTPSQILKKFRIIIIEFHFLESLLDPLGLKLIDNVFQKLLTFFEIIHIHPSHLGVEPLKYGKFGIPGHLEITFLRKDRISQKFPTKHFPHELDAAAVEIYGDSPLPDCWYDSD
jgi:hypothetical protein